MDESKSHDPERRRYPGVKAKTPIELLYSGKAQMRTATDEIRLCGCYIETLFTMDVGTKLALGFSLNQERVGANGIVVPSIHRSGMESTSSTWRLTGV
jgi:hypothetical protein